MFFTKLERRRGKVDEFDDKAIGADAEKASIEFHEYVNTYFCIAFKKGARHQHALMFAKVLEQREEIARLTWQTKLQQEKLIHEEFRVKEFEADIEKYNEMYDRHVAVRKERDQLKATCDRYEKALRDIATDIPCSDYVARQALEDSK